MTIPNYRLIAENEFLIVHKHVTLHHYIIQIIPAVEVFILKAVEELKKDVTIYDFNAKLEDFKRKTKNIESKRDLGLTNLCKAVLKAKNMNTLKCLLEYLITNKYNALESDIVKLIEK